MRARALLAPLAPLALVAACSFPDVTYDAGSGDGARDASADAGAADGTARGDGEAGGAGDASDAGDAPPPGDGAAEAGDAGDAGDAAPAPDGNPCDQDGDGHDAQGACGGDDCDDHDWRTHPGATYRFDPAVAPRFGDWDCDGKVEKLYTPSFSCGGVSTNCSTSNGFTDDPGCGNPGTFVTCKGVALCQVDTTSSQLQGCK